MMFVSFHYRDPVRNFEGFSNIMLDDTIEPSSPLDMINLSKSIEDISPFTYITILWWKIL